MADHNLQKNKYYLLAHDLFTMNLKLLLNAYRLTTCESVFLSLYTCFNATNVLRGSLIISGPSLQTISISMQATTPHP